MDFSTRFSISPSMPQILPPCPSSPNCVCSVDKDSPHFIEPICFSCDGELAWGTWIDLIRNHPHCVSMEIRDTCLSAVFETSIFRFKDDLESVLETDTNTIHIRSASRLGYWDIGANRRRIERLRRTFFQALIETT